jgi:hypothetical protein
LTEAVEAELTAIKEAGRLLLMYLLFSLVEVTEDDDLVVAMWS